MVYSLTILKGDSNMSLSTQQILSVIFNKATFWLSRNVGSKENPEWTNPDFTEVKEGDTVWFSDNATTEDIEEAKRLVIKANLHFYDKDVMPKKGTPAKDLRRTKNGSYSFIVLPELSTS